MRGVLEISAVRDDALLVVSELVTNAVIHSGCSPEETIALQAFLAEDCLRITVLDPGRSVETPVIPAKEHPHGGGLGLRLVALIARRWGVERPPGRLVWAELAV
jgi:anti-sigma regulatory factor (Ser/Thr protein kinase)